MGLFDKWRKEPIVEQSVIKSLSSPLFFSNFMDIPDGSPELTDIPDLAKFNPWISGSLIAISNNAIRPILKVYDNKGNIIDNEDLLLPIKYPNKYQNYTQFVQFCISSYLIYGRVLLQKVVVGNKVVNLLPLIPELVTVNLINGKIYYKYNGIDVNSDIIIDWLDTTINTSYYESLGRITSLIYQIGINQQIDNYNYNFFKNGAVPAGILTTEATLNDATMEKIKNSWKTYEGAKNTGKTPLLHGGLEYQAISTSHKEIGFDVLSNKSKEEIMAVMQVPPFYLGNISETNYSNAEVQRKTLWENTMIPILNSFANTLSEILPEGYVFKFDYSNISEIQQDYNQLINTVQLAVSAGYTIESVSQFLNIPFEIAEPEPIIEIEIPEPTPQPTQEDKIYDLIFNTKIKNIGY